MRVCVQAIQCVLPGMKERKRGCILNISSGVSAFLPACPLLSVYAASKAYVDTLSVSLTAECRACGVDVQVQPPYFVATKMSKIRRASLTVPTPRVWVQAAMRHVGYEDSACVFPVHAVITYAPLPVLVPPLVHALSLLSLNGLSLGCCQGTRMRV